jgi:hypothetical protein
MRCSLPADDREHRPGSGRMMTANITDGRFKRIFKGFCDDRA